MRGQGFGNWTRGALPHPTPTRFPRTLVYKSFPPLQRQSDSLTFMACDSVWGRQGLDERKQDGFEDGQAFGQDPEAAFRVDLDGYEGPLDLLLDLIRKQDIDIYDRRRRARRQSRRAAEAAAKNPRRRRASGRAPAAWPRLFPARRARRPRCRQCAALSGEPLRPALGLCPPAAETGAVARLLQDPYGLVAGRGARRAGAHSRHGGGMDRAR